MDIATKAQELVDFASANGIYIHSRTSPTEWAETLEEHNGECPCKHAPSCPCDDALVRTKNAEASPENQMCGCAFFVSKAYLDHYGRKPWVPGTSAVTTSEPAAKRTKNESKNFKFRKISDVNPELEKKALGKVNIYLNSLELIKDGNFDKLDDILAREEQENDCGVCAADAEIIRANARFVNVVCRNGDSTCKEELERLIGRTQQVIIENFEVAGYAPVTNESEVQPNQPKIKDTRRNAWTEFNSEISKHPALDGKSGKYRMKIAASIYRGEHETVEDAIEAIQE